MFGEGKGYTQIHMHCTTLQKDNLFHFKIHCDNMLKGSFFLKKLIQIIELLLIIRHLWY